MKLKKYNKIKILRYIIILLVIISYIFLYNGLDLKYILMNQSNSKMVYENKSNIYETILPVKKEIDTDPIVYIYNTHQTEGYYLNSLEHSIKPTVLYASYILKDHLNTLGVSSIVETGSIKKYLNAHKLDYTGSYEASRYYLKNALKVNKKLIYLIDLHRDSAGRKQTLYTKDNKNYARVMFVVSLKHKNYEENLSFVKSMNNKLEKEYKGLSRGIYERKDVIFNQDLSTKAFLIEVGGVDNKIDELNNTLEVIAKIISEDINAKKEK